MKYHAIHPIPVKDGYKREALIELSLEELRGLLEIINASLESPSKSGKAFLIFEKAVTTDAPYIACMYDKD